MMAGLDWLETTAGLALFELDVGVWTMGGWDGWSLWFVYTWALPVVCAIVVGFLINGYPVYVSSLFPFLYIELTSSDPSLNI